MFGGQGGVAVFGHAVRGGLALGCENVVQRIVCIGAGGQVVVARVHDVGAFACGIVRFHRFLIDVNGDGFARSGLQRIGLGIADQFDGGFFDAVRLVIVGVWGLHVQLHDIFAGCLAGVGDFHGYVEAAIGFLHRIIGPCEIGVGQAVSERICNLFGVIIIRAGLIAEHHILVAGLIITVADIDAFGICHVGGGETVCAIDDGIRTEIRGGRGGFQVVGVGVGQVAGRVHRAIERFGHAAGAGLSERTDPHDGIDGIVFQVGELHRILGVEQHHNLVEVVGSHLQHGTFVIVELQVRIAGCQLVGRQILAFAAGTADDYDRRIIIGGERLLHIVGVCGGRYLIDGEGALAIGVGGGLAVVLAGARGVELGQGRIHVESGLLERVHQRLGLGGIDGAGATTAIYRVNAILAEYGDLRRCFKRQRAVLVLEQRHTLSKNGGAHVGQCLFALVVGGVIRCEMLRGLIACRYDLGCRLIEIDGNQVRIFVGVHVAYRRGCGQYDRDCVHGD